MKQLSDDFFSKKRKWLLAVILCCNCEKEICVYDRLPSVGPTVKIDRLSLDEICNVEHCLVKLDDSIEKGSTRKADLGELGVRLAQYITEGQDDLKIVELARDIWYTELLVYEPITVLA